jgi:hypothetical protein
MTRLTAARHHRQEPKSQNQPAEGSDHRVAKEQVRPPGLRKYDPGRPHGYLDRRRLRTRERTPNMKLDPHVAPQPKPSGHTVEALSFVPEPKKLNGEFKTIGGRLFYVVTGLGVYFRFRVCTA